MPTLRLVLCLLLLASPALAQSRFRSSLTAAVIIPSGTEHGKQARQAGAARGGSVDAEHEALGCRQVTLRWAEAAGAKRYAVYVSARSAGPWTELPASNVCGAVRWAGATSLVDTEPTAGAPAVVHRLYYKVFAFAGAAADAPSIDVTDPVGVELP